MSSSPFKVILVGGGPVGLTAAHALSRAGIDFVLLEGRTSPVLDTGSNLVLSPLGMRALFQLGLESELRHVSAPLDLIQNFDHNGRPLGMRYFFELAKENFGISSRVISRHDLTKVLYDTLPADARANIHCNKKMMTIQKTTEGVNVSCADGTSYSGTIVIGADGAHSVVRREMRTLALASGTSDVNPEKPFLTTYQALWVRFPESADAPTGITCETHGPGAATQMFMGQGTGVLGLYERLPEPTQERIRFKKTDEQDIVDRWAHLPLTGSGKLTLRDVFDSRVDSGLVSLEEGVVPHWSFDGRIVLAGDAAHKFTPSTGAGCNNGIIDVVALVNELHSITTKSPSAVPERSQIQLAFKAYQDVRFKTISEQQNQSSMATAMATWETGVLKFLDRFVFSWKALQTFLVNKGAAGVASTPRFEFVGGEEPFTGKVPWASLKA